MMFNRDIQLDQVAISSTKTFKSTFVGKNYILLLQTELHITFTFCEISDYL